MPEAATDRTVSSILWQETKQDSEGQHAHRGGVLLAFSHLAPKSGADRDSDDIFFNMLPTPERTANSFVEHFNVLLLSQNQKLVLSALNFFKITLDKSSIQTIFKFLQTGFFYLLPIGFHQKEILVSTDSNFSWFHIVNHCVRVSTPYNTNKISRRTTLSSQTIRQIVFDCVLRPLEPFWQALCLCRLRLVDYNNNSIFQELISQFVLIAPYSRLSTILLLSRSICLLLTSVLTHSTAHTIISHFLKALNSTEWRWKQESDRRIRDRSRVIFRALRREGLTDELEQLAIRRYMLGNLDETVPNAMELMNRFGCNVFLEREEVDYEETDEDSEDRALRDYRIRFYDLFD